MLLIHEDDEFLKNGPWCLSLNLIHGFGRIMNQWVSGFISWNEDFKIDSFFVAAYYFEWI